MLLLRTLRARYTCAERANTYLDGLVPGNAENDEANLSQAQTLPGSMTQRSPSSVRQVSRPSMPSRVSLNLDGQAHENQQASSIDSDRGTLQERLGTSDTPSAALTDEHLSLLNQEFLSFAEHQRHSFTGATPPDLSWIESDNFEGSLFDMSILPVLPLNDFDGEQDNLDDTFGYNLVGSQSSRPTDEYRIPTGPIRL